MLPKDNQLLKSKMKFDAMTSASLSCIPEVGGVYSIYDVALDKYYVGSSKNLRERLNAQDQKIRGMYKYGELEGSFDPNNYQIILLEIGLEGRPELLNSEAYWCEQLNTYEEGSNESRDGSGFDSNRGRIWVNDGVNSFRIYPEQLADNPDLVQGFLGCKIKGKVNITRNGVDKRVEANQVDEYLSNGWRRGRELITTKLPDGYYGYDPARNKTWMNNGVEEVNIVDTWYQFWLDKGYKVGRLRENYVWVVKETDEMNIYEHEVEKYLADGWILGRRVQYYNGIESIHFDESLIPDRAKRCWVTKLGMDTNIEESRCDEYLADGWVRGRALTASRTADGSYSPDRHSVRISNGDEAFGVAHYYLPYWLDKGYHIEANPSQKYISNGIDEQLVHVSVPVPEGYEEKSLAEFHLPEIQEYYSRLTDK